MIENLCEKIKNKRKELGYSIEDVVKKTKLHPSVIRDIESCNLKNITPIYIKGFIKIYASFLEIETGGELEQIKTTGLPAAKKEEKPKKPKNNSFSKIHKKAASLFSKIPRRTRKNILLIAAVLIFLWLGFLGIRFSFRAVVSFFQNRPRQASEEPEYTEKISEAISSGRLSEFRASLTAEKPCFVRVIADGVVFFEGILPKGAVESWQADKELEFRISDGSAVLLEVNGQLIPRLSSIQRPVKRLIINSSGITIEK